MPRTKAFDPSQVLQKAMMTFWQYGYETTSIRDLEQALGITRFSIYSTFQDKEGLLLASLTLYIERVQQFFDRILDDGGIDAIETLLQSFSDPSRGFSESCYGCLVVNMILEGPQIGNEVQTRVQSHLQYTKQTLTGALQRAQQRQEIRADLNLGDCVDYLMSAMSGFNIVNRFAGDKRASQGAVRIAIDLIQSWKIPLKKTQAHTASR